MKTKLLKRLRKKASKYYKVKAELPDLYNIEDPYFIVSTIKGRNSKDQAILKCISYRRKFILKKLYEKRPYIF